MRGWLLIVLAVGELPIAAGATLGAESTATLDLTRLLVVLATTHLFLDATSLYQFSEPSYGFLNCLPISNQQLYHPATQSPFSTESFVFHSITRNRTSLTSTHAEIDLQVV